MVKGVKNIFEVSKESVLKGVKMILELIKKKTILKSVKEKLLMEVIKMKLFKIQHNFKGGVKIIQI